MFFQFESTKAALDILLHYAHDCDENLKKLYTKLATNNNFDHRSYNVRQCTVTFLALHKFCSDELIGCQLQITQLTSQINNILATLHQTDLKCAKIGIIHSLFNFLFGDSNSAEEINAIKNNRVIIKENQDK